MAKTSGIPNSVVALDPIFLLLVRLVLLYHLAAHILERRARTRVAERGLAGRPATLHGWNRFDALRLAGGMADPQWSRRRAYAPHFSVRGVSGGGGNAFAVPLHRESGSRDDRYGFRKLRIRPGPSWLLEHVHGRGRQICRHAVGQHEHGGKYRRRRRAGGRRIYPAVYRPKLADYVLDFGGDLRFGRAVLALDRPRHATGESGAA